MCILLNVHDHSALVNSTNVWIGYGFQCWLNRFLIFSSNLFSAVRYSLFMDVLRSDNHPFFSLYSPIATVPPEKCWAFIRDNFVADVLRGGVLCQCVLNCSATECEYLTIWPVSVVSGVWWFLSVSHDNIIGSVTGPISTHTHCSSHIDHRTVNDNPTCRCGGQSRASCTDTCRNLSSHAHALIYNFPSGLVFRCSAGCHRMCTWW